MSNRIILPALTFALATTALAANPPVKQPAKPVVLGTKQLDGQNARIGETFTVGKQQPVNITLQGAAFSTSRVMLGRQMVVPKANEKLLVLRFTAHNPSKTDSSLYGLRFTAVDARDVNHVSESAFVRAGTAEEFRASLKPAQKVELVSVIRVPAAGVVPKLIAQRGDGPVVRYDLRGQARPVPAPFADPRDASGATALVDAPGKLGAVYAFGQYDMKLEEVSFSKEPMLGREAPTGKRYVMATVTMKNAGADAASPSHYSFDSELLDVDGEPVPFWVLAKGSRPEEAINRSVKPGEEYRVRLVYIAPDNVSLRSLVLREPGTHGVVFDLTQVK